MTATYAALGTILIIVAIPLAVAMRRADRAINDPFRGATA
jgi:hypothetical protein